MFTTRPINELGAQLCPRSIATRTPQYFRAASPPATSTSQGVPHNVGARRNPAQIRQVRAGGSDSEAFRRWFTLVTPSRIASRTRPVWQYQNVPSLSRLLPPNQSIPTSQAASSFTQSAATN